MPSSFRFWQCFLHEKLVSLCHGPGVGEPGAGDAARSGGVWGPGCCHPPSRKPVVSTNGQELQQHPSPQQPSQHQLPSAFCLPCLSLNWSHEAKVDSGKCSWLSCNYQECLWKKWVNWRNNVLESIFVPSSLAAPVSIFQVPFLSQKVDWALSFHYILTATLWHKYIFITITKMKQERHKL